MVENFPVLFYQSPDFPSALVVSGDVQIEGKYWLRIRRHRPRVTRGQATVALKQNPN